MTDLAVLLVPVGTLDELVKTRPALAREFGKEIDNRRERTFEAFANAGLAPPGRLASRRVLMKGVGVRA